MGHERSKKTKGLTSTTQIHLRSPRAKNVGWHLQQRAMCPLAPLESACGFVLRNSQFVGSGAAFFKLLPFVMCDLRMLEVMSSGTSSDEENEHNVGNLSLEVVGQGWSGTLLDGFLEDRELARVAGSCHLARHFRQRKGKLLWRLNDGDSPRTSALGMESDGWY